jgi:predicted MFS family arabinose efflux permease
MTTGEIGTWLGLILGIPGGIGIVLGGYLADRIGGRDARWYMWVVAVALMVTVPFSAAVFLADAPAVALALFGIPVLLGNFYQATTFSQVQGLVGLRMRAVAAAILLFVLNIIGLGLGPYLVGLLSDALSDRFGIESLRYALLAASFVNLWAAAHYFVAGRHLKGDLAAAPP